jgi:hypothetical protein
MNSIRVCAITLCVCLEGGHMKTKLKSHAANVKIYIFILTGSGNAIKMAKSEKNLALFFVRLPAIKLHLTIWIKRVTLNRFQIKEKFIA